MKIDKSTAPPTMRTSKFMLYCQENDLTVDGAMTDVKGDRSKAPTTRTIRLVPARGGAPARRRGGLRRQGPQTGIINSHEVIVMPPVHGPRRQGTTPSPSPFPWTPRASS